MVRKCFVPTCKNSSDIPNKKFIYVPKLQDNRERWLEAVGRELTYTTNLFCCEDHFDLPNDMVNYMKYSLMGGNIVMKTGVVPHLMLTESKENSNPNLEHAISVVRTTSSVSSTTRMTTPATSSSDLSSGSIYTQFPASVDHVKPEIIYLENQTSDADEIDFNQKCRCCLINTGDMTSFYDLYSSETCVSELYTLMTSLEVSRDQNLLPTKICHECLCELSQSYKFVLKCRESDNKLRKYQSKYKNNKHKITHTDSLSVKTANAFTQTTEVIVFANDVKLEIDEFDPLSDISLEHHTFGYKSNHSKSLNGGNVHASNYDSVNALNVTENDLIEFDILKHEIKVENEHLNDGGDAPPGHKLQSIDASQFNQRRESIDVEDESRQDVIAGTRDTGARKSELVSKELREMTNTVSINETDKKLEKCNSSTTKNLGVLSQGIENNNSTDFQMEEILPEQNNEFPKIYNNDEVSDDSFCYDSDEDPDYDYFQNQTTDSESESVQVSVSDTSRENVIETEGFTKKSVPKSREKDFCFFCETYIINFSRHIYRNHSNEIEVAQILSKPSKSKQRKDLLSLLRKKGNYSINTDKCKRPMKKTECINETKFLPCTYCLGFYSAKFLWRHRKFCTQNPNKATGKAQSDGQNYLTRHLIIDEEIRETVFPRMRPDHISLVAKKDPLICAFGARYIRTHREKHFINVVSRKMRDLAKLLIELTKIDNSIENLFSALQPKYFDTFIAATKTVAKYNTEKECFQSPTYTMNLSTSLKQCCEIAMLFCRKRNDVYATIDAAEGEASLKTMIQLLDSHWKNDISISSQTADDLNSKKCNKMSLVPFASDLKLLKEYLTVQSNNAASRLITDNIDIDAYSTLIETVFCRIVLLNRERPGELQRINIHVYESAMKENTHNYVDFNDTVSPTENILMKRFKRIVIRGKRGRGVPVLLSTDVQEHIKLMIQFRANFIPKENFYLFGKPKLNTPICGYKIITNYATKCGAKHPNAITCPRLRKHLATITQIFNMSNNDVEQLATFMGHTSDGHRNAYRLPDDVYQTAKISKLLLLMETRGTNEYKGISIDEIDINLDEDLLENKPLQTEEDLDVIADQINEQYEHENTIIETESTLSIKKKKRRILTPWTKQQKQTVESFFEKHIRNKISPKKPECDILREQHPELLKNKDWLKIKVYIQNKYTK